MPTPDWLLDVEFSGPMSGEQLSALKRGAGAARRRAHRRARAAERRAAAGAGAEDRRPGRPGPQRRPLPRRLRVGRRGPGPLRPGHRRDHPRQPLLRRHAGLRRPRSWSGCAGPDFTWPRGQDAASPTARLVDGQGRELFPREALHPPRRHAGVDAGSRPRWSGCPAADEPLLAVAWSRTSTTATGPQLALAAGQGDLEAMVEQRTAALTQRDVLLREVYHRVKNNLQIVDGLLMMQARRLADAGGARRAGDAAGAGLRPGPGPPPADGLGRPGDLRHRAVPRRSCRRTCWKASAGGERRSPCAPRR